METVIVLVCVKYCLPIITTLDNMQQVTRNNNLGKRAITQLHLRNDEMSLLATAEKIMNSLADICRTCQQYGCKDTVQKPNKWVSEHIYPLSLTPHNMIAHPIDFVKPSVPGMKRVI